MLTGNAIHESCWNIWMQLCQFVKGPPSNEKGTWVPIQGHTWQHCYVRRCFFGVFKALDILNGYGQSVQMERAWNSDSETHVKKYNWTSEMGHFFETSCTYRYVLEAWWWLGSFRGLVVASTSTSCIQCLVFVGICWYFLVLVLYLMMICDDDDWGVLEAW